MCGYFSAAEPPVERRCGVALVDKEFVLAFLPRGFAQACAFRYRGVEWSIGSRAKHSVVHRLLCLLAVPYSLSMRSLLLPLEYEKDNSKL